MAVSTSTSARQHRGRFTRIEKDIAKLKDKMTLGPTDQRRIKHPLEKVKADNNEFEQCHLEVLKFIEEDHNTLDVEEKAYDAHGSHVVEICERPE